MKAEHHHIFYMAIAAAAFNWPTARSDPSDFALLRRRMQLWKLQSCRVYRKNQ